MDELKKLIAKLLKKGFATASEKKAVRDIVKELDGDENEEVVEEVEKVENLPEEEETPDDTEVEKGLKKLLSKAVKEVSEDVKSEVSAHVRKELAKIKQGDGVYQNDVKEARKGINQKMVGMCKSLFSGNEVAMKDLTTDATGSPYGGYTVDTELSAEIRHLITEYGVASREMNALQLSKHNYKANNLATDVVTYWVDEAGSIKSSQAVLGQGTLDLNKIATIVSFTSELLEDSEIDWVSFIGGRVAEAMAEMEDEAFFNGDGTSTYGSFTGLLNNTSVNEVVMTGTTFASLDADDLIDMVDSTPSGALANAKFYMNRTIMSLVRKLKDSNNDYIYQRPSESGPATIWGYPVVLVEVMPTTSDTAADTSLILFGDLKKACIYGFKGGIKADIFRSGSVRNSGDSADVNLITTDREAIRWTRRVGYLAILPTAVTKLTTATASA